MILKGNGNFWQKLNCGFQISPHKNLWICFHQPRTLHLSNFIGLFCLQAKLLDQKTFKAVSFFDTEGPWKVWAKTGLYFPIQPKINELIFLQQARRVKFSNFICLFCLKGKLPEPKILTVVWFWETEGPWKVLTKTEWRFRN